MEFWYQLIFEPIRALSSLAALIVLAATAVSFCVWMWRLGCRWAGAQQYPKLKWTMPGFVFFFVGPWLFWFFFNAGSWFLHAGSYNIFWIMGWWYTMEQSIGWVIGAVIGMGEYMALTYSRSGVILLLVWIFLMGFGFLAYIVKWRFRLLFIPATLLIVWMVAHQQAPATVFDSLLPASYEAILVTQQSTWNATSAPIIPEGRAWVLFLVVALLYGVPVIASVKEVKRVIVVFLVLNMAVVALWPVQIKETGIPAHKSMQSELQTESEDWYRSFVMAYRSGDEAEIIKWVNLINEKLHEDGIFENHDLCLEYADLFPEICQNSRR